MAITTTICTSFKAEMLSGLHDFKNDVFRIALYTSAATLDATTEAYTTTGETSGTGYTAGGELSAASGPATSGTTAFVDLADTSWTGASFTARGMLIYNVSQANASVAAIDFGGDFIVSVGTFTLNMPTSGASTSIIRIT